MTWKAETFYIAAWWGAYAVAGYTYRALGLHMQIKGSPKGRRPPSWALTHLGSGHCICQIKGKVADALPIATDIAECGDWDFDGLDGWKNRDPNLPAKVITITDRYAKQVSRMGGRREGAHEVAAEIARMRA